MDIPWIRIGCKFYEFYQIDKNFQRNIPKAISQLNGMDNEIILDKSRGQYVYDTSFFGKEDNLGWIVLTNHHIVFLSSEKGENFIFYLPHIENITSIKIRKFYSACEFKVSHEKHIVVGVKDHFIEAAKAEHKKFSLYLLLTVLKNLLRNKQITQNSLQAQVFARSC